jgi:hypothetical protein
VVEHLPSTHEAMSSNPSNKKKKKKRTETAIICRLNEHLCRKHKITNRQVKGVQKEMQGSRILVSHTYNPSYLGGRDQEDPGWMKVMAPACIQHSGSRGSRMVSWKPA